MGLMVLNIKKTALGMELIKRYMLDTNAIIYLISGRLALPLPEGQYSVSIITEMSC